MPDLTIRLVKRHTDAFSLDISLQLPSTGVSAIFGPSGSGKTTLLRCIAGLDKSEVGEICLDEDIWQNASIYLPAHQRPIGYVFQEASLFSHLTALDNLTFAMKRADKKRAIVSFNEIIQLLSIEPFLDKYPHQLSGGERQRVAIARALLIQPQVLLMDEPLSALDDALKQEILPYLEKLCKQLKIPILYVSHSINEVIRLADHLVVLDKGHVVDQGATQAVLAKLPMSPIQTHDSCVLITGTVVEKDHTWGLSKMHFSGHYMLVKQGQENVGDTIRLRVQSSDVSISLTQQDNSSILNRLNTIIDELIIDPRDPSMMIVRMLAGDTAILASITALSANKLKLSKGLAVIAQIKSAAVVR